ncbi:metallophosphoesterase [Polyangium jinanense]|uniref:Metallophosphoesterase n=1 Tax=Polyangium jinanense TaxID=2829994 RepID=A0A9X3X3P4_9BACT|nr:metallophosphoesterase [Polyangium jinanense]MDC3955317.1 metallophosphoesterase [Polyangium jinanense]MDC3981618.1 metallophosphoesterase [Polyangium jinanense]
MQKRLSRRDLLRVVGCCAVGIVALDALVLEPSWLEIAEHDVPVPGLPRGFEGFRIAHLSDLHLSSLGSVHDAILAAMKSFQPNLVVLTGDSVEDPNALAVLSEFCRALAATGREVVATVGNWEHWGEVPMDELRRSFVRVGARLLGNESTRLTSGIAVVATDDFCSGHHDLTSALRDAPAGPLRLFLTHAPGIFDELPKSAPRFDLGLAGHTHGGQVRALGAPLWVPPGSGRFRSGMYTTDKGQIYVSRGIGTSVLPVRFTCRPELPVFRLVAG